MKRRSLLFPLLALLLIVALCFILLTACGTPSKSTVAEYADQVLTAIIHKDSAALQSLANPDYAGYFSEEEMQSYYEQYTEWGVCGEDVTFGNLKRTSWQTSRNYYGDKGSEAEYTVSIGGILYEFEIVVVKNDDGVGLANFELERIG